MSEIMGNNEPFQDVVCNNCKHFNKDGLSCLAFDRIPKEIIFGRLKHDNIIDDQKGAFIYTPG